MKTFKAEMGTDWAENSENRFGELNSMQALTELSKYMFTNKEQELHKHPQYKRLLEAAANATESDLIAWGNGKFSLNGLPLKRQTDIDTRGKAIEAIDKNLHLARSIQSQSRVLLKMPDKKTTIN